MYAGTFTRKAAHMCSFIQMSCLFVTCHSTEPPGASQSGALKNAVDNTDGISCRIWPRRGMTGAAAEPAQAVAPLASASVLTCPGFHDIPTVWLHWHNEPLASCQPVEVEVCNLNSMGPVSSCSHVRNPLGGGQLALWHSW